jgi:probable F420-dependent oxidoreductase
MKFGIRYCNTGRYCDPDQAVALVQAAEEAGFESAWTIEHTVIPKGYQSAYPYAAGGRLPGGEGDFILPDPQIWMAWVAAHTSRIKLATGILILPQHNPVICAKQVATLDHMSKGRVILGIGVGWLKEEFEALGVPFAERGARTEEYMHALRALWTMDCPSYEGRFVRFKDAYMRPKPHGGTVPIVIGGHSKAAAERAGRLADGFFPARGASAELIAEVRHAAEAAGRDPKSVEITASMPDEIEQLPALAAAGISRVLLPVTGVAGLKQAVKGPEDVLRWKDTVEKYAAL